jgi:TaqI-like C-terminal specificity domain
MGINLDRWGEHSNELWIIYIPKNKIDITKYPAVEGHLLKHRLKLEMRVTKQKWFELQQPQVNYLDKMAGPKIVYNRFLAKPKFFLDLSGRLINDAPYFIPTDNLGLLALLNSNVFWFTIASKATALSGGYFQLHAQYVEQLSLPENVASLDQLADYAKDCMKFYTKSGIIESQFTRRIPDLCPPEREAKLSTKLQDWWKLADFAAFRAEVKKVFKSEIPLKERSDWEDLFVSGKTEIEKLSAEIKRNEDEINAIVYKLFDLTPDEIALLEESIGAK